MSAGGQPPHPLTGGHAQMMGFFMQGKSEVAVDREGDRDADLQRGVGFLTLTAVYMGRPEHFPYCISSPNVCGSHLSSFFFPKNKAVRWTWL